MVFGLPGSALTNYFCYVFSYPCFWDFSAVFFLLGKNKLDDSGLYHGYYLGMQVLE